MIDRTAPQVVRNYLTRLEAELVGVPADVRDGIVAGVAEELDGLDATAAAARIETLGDPAFIAAEARADEPAPVTAPAIPAQRGYVVITTLLIAFGGILIPIIGWGAGIFMMWASRLWTRWEKILATVLPPVVGLVVGLLGFLVRGVPADGSAAEPINPLVPFGAHVALLGVTLAVVITAIVMAVVLAARAMRRTAR